MLVLFSCMHDAIGKPLQFSWYTRQIDNEEH